MVTCQRVVATLMGLKADKGVSLVERKHQRIYNMLPLLPFQRLVRTLNSVLLATCYQSAAQVKAELIHFGHISHQDALLWAPASPCRYTSLLVWNSQIQYLSKSNKYDNAVFLQAWSPVKHFRQIILAMQISARRTDTFLR